MKVLVVGSGGREHALTWKLSQNPQIKDLYCAPGNAGTARLATNVPLSPNDIAGLLEFARSRQTDLTVVGPEAPLVAGIVDRFQEAGLPIAGPCLQAARLEGSKAFAKDFMVRHRIPTARHQTFASAALAGDALESGAFDFPVVLKADGLAAGKGVFICSDLEESLRVVTLVMRERTFGSAGDRLVVEEFLQGQEVSFMVFTDGTQVLPMVPAQDHKAIFEGDQGPNTGGMGAYSMETVLSPAEREQILEQIIHPAVEGMAADGQPYRGILYAGLMMTADGPQVLEFNARFGDPETQAVLPRMESDLLEVLHGCASGNLKGVFLRWSSEAVVCVVLAAPGYPGAYPTGTVISGLDEVGQVIDTIAFHAGTRLEGDRIVTSGGRVLGITSKGPDLRTAIVRAYQGVEKVRFEGMYYRKDIGSKGLRKEQR